MRRSNNLQMGRKFEFPHESKGVIKKAIIPTFCFAVLSTVAFEEAVFAESATSPAGVRSQVSAAVKYVNVASGTLNLRKTASSNSPILTSLKNGTALTVYSEVNGWALVQVNGMEGYVSTAFISESSKTTAASPVTKYVNTDSGSLNLRESPAASGKVLDKLTKGTAVTVYSEANGWAKVQVNGKEGYVSSDFLSSTNPSSAPAQSPAPTVVKDKYVNVSSGSLNMRNGSSTNASVIVKLAKGTPVKVYSEANGWAKIEAYGKTGYVSSEFLSDTPPSSSNTPPAQSPVPQLTTKYVNVNSGSSLNVRASASTSSSVLGKLGSQSEVQVISETNGWAKIQFNGKEGYVSSSFLTTVKPNTAVQPEQPAATTKVVNVNIGSSLNMRNSPAANASILVKLARGLEVKVLSEANGWAKVEAYGKTGYVSSEFLSDTLSSSGNSSSAPAPDPAPQLTIKYVNVNSGSSLNVRASASTGSSIIGKLDFQSEVQVISETNGWAKIQFNGKEGYVSSSFLTAVKSGAPAQQPEQPAAVAKYVNVNVGSSLNMRKSPAANASMVKLARGLEVKVLSEANGWTKIEAYGQMGYVSSEFLSADKNLGASGGPANESGTGAAPPNPNTDSDANPPAEAQPGPGQTPEDSPASGTNTDSDPSPEQSQPAAETKYVDVIFGSSLNMRANPSTNAAIITKLARGTIVTVQSVENNWAMVTANGKTGYVSVLYLSDAAPFNPNATGGNIEKTVENYNISLSDMVKLQMAVNPQTDKDYYTFIRSDALTLTGPSTGIVNGSGWNLRGGAGTDYWVVGQVKNHDTLQILAVVTDDKGMEWYQVAYNKSWVNASPEDVAYYLDPNNFQDSAVDSMQFLKLSMTANLNANEVNERVLAGKGILQSQAATFITAGMTYGVNEMYLISHALLETANGSSQLANGVLYNGRLVYNMYGIGAYDNSAVNSGAQFAYNAGWFTPEDAIIGGAQFIANGYINAGQDTLYKMRWNPDSAAQKGYASHQYATDIGWAAKQVKQIYNLYSLIDSYKLILEIPQYK